MKPNLNREQFLIEDRRVPVSAYGVGNPKLGPGVYTYSTLPGRDEGTCPGSTSECEAICYAKRIRGLVRENYRINQERGANIPDPPADAKMIRWHVSGDFFSDAYIRRWIEIASARPEVTFWGYTRSWRVAYLIESLVELRDLPNVWLWASVDSSSDVPGPAWRRAWIEGDSRLTEINDAMFRTFDGRLALVCPEERKVHANCVACRYCWQDKAKDLVFLRH